MLIYILTLYNLVNLAIALNRKKLKVGVLDADLFGPSIPKLLNLNGEPELNEKGHLLPLKNYGLASMSMGFLVPEGAPIVWRGLMVILLLFIIEFTITGCVGYESFAAINL